MGNSETIALVGIGAIALLMFRKDVGEVTGGVGEAVGGLGGGISEIAYGLSAPFGFMDTAFGWLESSLFNQARLEQEYHNRSQEVINQKYKEDLRILSEKTKKVDAQLQATMSLYPNVPKQTVKNLLYEEQDINPIKKGNFDLHSELLKKEAEVNQKTVERGAQSIQTARTITEYETKQTVDTINPFEAVFQATKRSSKSSSRSSKNTTSTPAISKFHEQAKTSTKLASNLKALGW